MVSTNTGLFVQGTDREAKWATVLCAWILPINLCVCRLFLDLKDPDHPSVWLSLGWARWLCLLPYPPLHREHLAVSGDFGCHSLGRGLPLASRHWGGHWGCGWRQQSPQQRISASNVSSTDQLICWMQLLPGNAFSIHGSESWFSFLYIISFLIASGKQCLFCQCFNYYKQSLTFIGLVFLSIMCSC